VRKCFALLVLLLVVLPGQSQDNGGNVQARPTSSLYQSGGQKGYYLVDDAGNILLDDAGNAIIER